jgi:hypothetical protein
LVEKDQLRDQDKPSIVFFSGHRIISANGKEALGNIMRGIGPAVIITKAKSVGLQTSLGFKVFEKDEQYAILESK